MAENDQKAVKRSGIEKLNRTGGVWNKRVVRQ